MKRSSFVIALLGLLTITVACGDSATSTKKDAATGGGSGGTSQANGGSTGAATGGKTGSGAGGAAGAMGGTVGSGAGGAAGGTTGSASGGTTGGGIDAAMDAQAIDANLADVPMGETGGGEVGLTGPAARGEYLVKSVLGCVSCHTPQLPGGGGLDNSKFLSGNDCFAKDSSGGCLASANLTNDSTGLKDLTDTQIKNAFTKGIDPEAGPDGGVQYLFSQMPYYQFANLTDDDASAIVAYLRTVPAVVHETTNTGTFVSQPSAAQWLPVALADFPNALAVDSGANVANGKYLAALACATCHTPNTAATSPLQLDVSKAFIGGKKYNTTVAALDGGASNDGGSTTKEIQSSNLTPDSTGLLNWTPAQVVTAIKQGKDEAGRTICSPMRSLPNISTQDATDIANYLLGLPPVANPSITETCE
jgi:mono/diheme cytochrome c family protein